MSNGYNCRMTANDLWLGVPTRAETKKTNDKISALPSFAAFIGADPWSPRRAIAIIIALRIAVTLSQWGLYRLNPLDWFSPALLLSLTWIVVRVGTAVAVFRLAKREMTGAII